MRGEIVMSRNDGAGAGDQVVAGVNGSPKTTVLVNGDPPVMDRGRVQPKSRISPFVKVAERIGVPVALLIVIVIFGFLEPSTFLTTGNLTTILASQAVLVVLTLGLIIPLRAGDYDLSIAGTLTLSAMMIGVLNAHMGIPIWLAIICALAMGVSVGFINGFLSLFFRIDPFIVTLGMGTLLLGVVLLISGDQTFSGVSTGLVNVVIIDRFLGVPLEFYYVLMIAAVIHYVFEYTTVGKRLLFVGTGREVARLSGIRVGKLRIGALVSSGFLGALAGIIYAGTSGSADPSSGASFLLPAFAAAYLGATTIMPGRFNPWGAVVAAYFLITGVTGLAILGINTWVQDVFYGGALIIAVVMSQLVRRRQQQDIA
jgi:ribose transport system permease protein